MEKKKALIIFIVFVILTIPLLFFFKLPSSNDFKNDDYMSRLVFENLSTKKEVGRTVTIEETNNNVYKKINYPEIGNQIIDDEIKKQIEDLTQTIEKEYIKESTTVNYYYFIDYENYIGTNDLLSIVIIEKIESVDLKLVKDNYYTYIYNLRTSKLLTNDDLFEDGYLTKIEELTNKKITEDFKYIINDNKLIINKNIEISLEDLKEYLKFTITEDNYSNETEEYQLTITNKEKQVTEDIVVYKSNSLDSEIQDTLKKDTVIKVYGEYNNGFSMILYNNKIGYIDSKKTKNVEKKEEPKPSTNKKVYIIRDANIREDANANAQIIGEVKSGTEVTKIGEKNGWIQIKYNDITGYVNSSLISNTKKREHTLKENVPPQGTIDPSKPMVALTFDDGPSAAVTPRILSTLEKYNVHATFFDVGNLISKNPDIVKREAKIGEVGLHTYSHKNLNTLSTQAIKEEMSKANDAYRSVLGYDAKLMRPPYGNANKTVRDALTDYKIINWNVDSLDWKYRDKDLTLDEIDKYGDLNGKIILMHSIHAPTADAVEILIPDLLDRGYQVVTVTELAAYKGYNMESGVVYYGFK